MSSIVRSKSLPEAALPVPIQIRHLKTAKRLRLRLDEASGMLKLTCPSSMRRADALAWALDQRTWIETQLARRSPAEPFAPGSAIPIEGRPVTIVWSAAAPRTPVIQGDELRLGGPLPGLARRVESFLKKRALEVMSAEVAHYAALTGTVASSVSVGDAGTRWGSCSSLKRIRLSWRLILAPPECRRYVVAHEVAHLVHLNHGPEFRALEARLFGPGLSQAKKALRDLGPRLRSVGRIC
jgi:predicted metal-dependent hydrolase